MINKKFLMLAVVLGLVITIAVNQYIKKEVGSVKKKEVPTFPVVVAAVNIKTREVLKKEMLVVKRLPREYILEGAVVTIEDAEGKITLGSMIAGEQLLRAKIREKGSRLGLSFKIPENKRAVAIRVAGAAGIAGLVQPGDLVDVLVTYSNLKAGATGKTETKTVTVLQNVQVLAIDQTTESFSEDGTEKRGGGSGLVTFALTLEEAELLTLANSKGQLSLALRAFNDKSTVESQGADITELLKSKRINSEKPTKKVYRRKRRSSGSIEVIKGTDKKRIRVLN